MLTLPIRETIPATPRAHIVRVDLQGHRFDYLAGQAVLLGPHQSPRRKPFSLASAPEDARRDDVLELLIGLDAADRMEPRLVLEAGTLVDVEGPVGRFTCPAVPRERRFLFIAGGTGIAPLRAMLHHVLNVPHDHVGLLYSARTPDDFAYEDEFQALAAAGRIELRQTVTREAADHAWSGIRGRIGHSLLTPLVHDPSTLCFICGPPALVSEIPQALAALGVARDRIRIEEWSRG